MNIRNKEELMTYLEGDKPLEYLFFWGHQKPKSGVSKACFSQWYVSPFSHQDIHYQTAEHFMMAEKARLFADDKVRAKILSSKNPHDAKKLGRKIANFDEAVWLDNRFEIVKQAKE